MTTEELIQALGDLLSGLQVPLSLRVPLGTAEKPLRALYDELDSFMYPSGDEFAKRLRERL